MFFIILACTFIGIATYIWFDVATNPPLPKQEEKNKLYDAQKDIIIPDEVKNAQDIYIETTKSSNRYMEKKDEEKESNSKINTINPIQSENPFARVADYDTFFDGIRKNHKIKKYKDNKMILRNKKKLALKNNQDNNDDGPTENL